MNTGDELQSGQRVWVLDADTPGGKAWGTISPAGTGAASLSGVGSFVVIVLDGGNVVLSCPEAHRGVQWDLAVPPEARNAGSPAPA